MLRLLFGHQLHYALPLHFLTVIGNSYGDSRNRRGAHFNSVFCTLSFLYFHFAFPVSVVAPTPLRMIASPISTTSKGPNKVEQPMVKTCRATSTRDITWPETPAGQWAFALCPGGGPLGGWSLSYFHYFDGFAMCARLQPCSLRFLSV